MGVHIRCTVVCRWDLFAKLNDDVDKSRLIASVADVNTVFDFQNVVFYFSIAGSHRMASVWIVDWFPFWQHAPLMPVVSPSSVSWSVIFFFAISHRILIVRCVQVSFGELVTCPITSPPRDREMYGMSTWYVGQAATLTRHPHNVLMYYKPKPSGTLPLRGVIIRAVHTCVTYLLSQLRKYEIIVPNYEYFGIKKGALGL